MKRGVGDRVDNINNNGCKKQKIMPDSEPTFTILDINEVNNTTENNMVYSNSDSFATLTPGSDTMSTDEGEEEYSRGNEMSVEDNDEYKTSTTKNNSKNSSKMNKSIGRMFLKLEIGEKKRFNLTENKNKDDTKTHVNSVWPSICLDLYTINYLKETYFERNALLNNICNYSIPLAFSSLSSNDNISLYTRIYKQLPLRHCIRLSVFRWIACIIKSRIKFNIDNANLGDNVDITSSDTVSNDELKRNMFVRWAIEIKLFLDRMLDNIPQKIYSNSDACYRVDESINKLKRSRSVKTRFKFSEFGKEILQNDKQSFQPVVPHSLIANIQCTLTCGNLFCQQRTEHPTLKHLYAHELEMSQSTDTLGNFPYHSRELRPLRHTVICHLAGWPEGSAMFGLHQLFGSNESKSFQNTISTIFAFVHKLVYCYRKNILFETIIDKKEAMMKEDHDEDVYGDVDDDLYDWMNNIFSDEDEEEESIDGVQSKTLACEEEDSKILKKQKINANISKASIPSSRNNDIQSLNRKMEETNENNLIKSNSKKVGLRQSSSELSFLKHIYLVNKKIENKNKYHSYDLDEVGLGTSSNKKHVEKFTTKAMMHRQKKITGKECQVGALQKTIMKHDNGLVRGKEINKGIAKNSTTATMEFFDIEMQRDDETDQTELLVFAEEEKHFFFSCFYPDATVFDFFYVFCSCFWPCVILSIRQKLYGHKKQWFSCTVFNFLLFISRWFLFTLFTFFLFAPVVAPYIHRGRFDKRDHISPERSWDWNNHGTRRKIVASFMVGCLVSATILAIYRAKYKLKRGEKDRGFFRNFCSSLFCTTCTVSQMYYDTRDW